MFQCSNDAFNDRDVSQDQLKATLYRKSEEYVSEGLQDDANSDIFGVIHKTMLQFSYSLSKSLNDLKYRVQVICH